MLPRSKDRENRLPLCSLLWNKSFHLLLSEFQDCWKFHQLELTWLDSRLVMSVDWSIVRNLFEYLHKKTSRLLGVGRAALFHTLHQRLQHRVSRQIIDASPLFATGKQTAALHQTEVFGSHCRWQLTRLSQFTHRILTRQHHLDHPQSVRMSQHAQTLCDSPQGVKISQLEWL